MPDKFSRNPTAFVRLFIETGLFFPPLFDYLFS